MSLRYFKYELPLSTPFRWADQSISTRKGILVRYKNNNITSWGEMAPLSGISAYTTEEVMAWLKEDFINQIDHLLSENCSFHTWNRTLEHFDLPPSLRFGHDMLFIHTSAQYQQCSPTACLFEQSLDDISINATLSIQPVQPFLDEADSFYKRGFRTFKCKIGRNFNREYQCIKALRNQYPEIDIRVDVNGSWSLEQARENLASLLPFQIQYCEQPVPADRWSDLVKLSSETPVDLALDESITDMESLKDIIEAQVVDYIVIKPMKLGAVRPIMKRCMEAMDKNITPVFSSLLDSGIARSMYGVLAAGLSQADTAHGLATGHIFKRDLLPIDRTIQEGRYTLQNEFSDCSGWSDYIKYQNLVELSVT